MKDEKCYKFQAFRFVLFLFLIAIVFSLPAFTAQVAYAKTCGQSGADCSSDECLSNCEGSDEANDRVTCLLKACDAVSTCDQILTESKKMINLGLLDKTTKDVQGRTFLDAFDQDTTDTKLDLLNNYKVDITQPPYNQTSCYLTAKDEKNALTLKAQGAQGPDTLQLNAFGTFNTMEGGFGSGNNIKINDFIMGIVSTGGAIIGGLAVLKIIFGGVMYATAAGNPQRISDAKSHILYALLGIALIAGANIILMLFGASPIQ